MAKLSAHGTSLLTYSLVDSSPTLTSRHMLRLMSDGVVLAKFDGVFTDGTKLTGTWKRRGKVKDFPKDQTNQADYEAKVQVFRDYAAKLGYNEGN